MKKEIKNFDQIVKILLIILTIISLIMNALYFTNMIYNSSYDTTNLNAFLISKPANIILWADNLLIYLLGILYIISAIQEKKEMLLKICFSLFSIFTTMIITTFIINFIASIFGIF